MKHGQVRSSGTTAIARLPERLSLAEWAALALFAAILLLGGAGLDFPILSGIVQTAAVLLLAIQLFQRGAPVGWLAWTLVAAFALLIALQLIPLPGRTVFALPGRETAAGILAAAGISPAWHSLSLDPARTADVALGLLPALALLITGCRARPHFLAALIATLLCFALASTVLGAFQRVDGALPSLFPAGHDASNAPGFFVNRNHQASLLLVAIPLVACYAAISIGIARRGHRARQLLAWLGIILFATGIAATSSRAGLLLLPLALAAAWLILRRQRTGPLIALATLLPIGLAIAAASLSPAVQATLDRFEQDEVLRPQYWQNSAVAARSYWPAGSGLGTFTQVYPGVEPLEQLSIPYVNNAHNDYIETWLETGVAAVALFALLIVVAAWGATQRMRTRGDAAVRSAATAALMGLLMFAAHSIADYPLRMAALCAVAGLLYAMLLRTNGARDRASVAARVIGLAVLAALLVPIWAIAASNQALKDGAPKAAIRFNPWSAEALTAAGAAALRAGAVDQARDLAERAIAAAPLNAAAAALLIDAQERGRDAAGTERMLAAAAKLGFREPRIQYRLTQAALAREDDRTTVRHADALLRTGNYVADIRPFLRQLQPFPAANAALVAALARQPNWREQYLLNLADLSDEAIASHQQLLAGLARTKAPPTPPERGAFFTQLIRRERFAEAIREARRVGWGSAGPDLLAAPATAPLKALGRPLDPFAWRRGSARDFTVELNDTGAIDIRSNRAAVGPALWRLVILEPGRVTLRGSAREQAPGAFAAAEWTLRCRGSEVAIIPGAVRRAAGADQEIRFALDFDIPAVGCPAQTLQLGIDSSAGSADLTLLRLVLDR